MPLINLIEANGKNYIQGFVPRNGLTINGDYTPSEPEAMKLGNVVEIVIDGVIVEYNKGEILLLEKGVTYTFNSETAIHKM